MLFYPLYYDIISLTSLKTTQAFHLLLGFAENQIVLWDFKIRNSIRITEGADNVDLDNQAPTVLRLHLRCISTICSLLNNIHGDMSWSLEYKYWLQSIHAH